MTTLKMLCIIVLILVTLGGAYFILSRPPQPPVQEMPPAFTEFDGKNITFTIDGTPVTLVDGVATIAGTRTTVRYFGNEARGDMDGDDLSDVAFLVTSDGGGSGTFYYVVLALRTDTGYAATNAFFIGDRIAPQSTDINTSARELQVNYAERAPGEPMTTPPSIHASLLLKVTPDGRLEGLMQ